MTYQQKSIGKMADFETLTLLVSPNSRQMYPYFYKDLVTECCGKKSDSEPSSPFKLALLPTPYCYGFDVT